MKEKLTRDALAKRRKTSRAALDYLLDPANPSVTLTILGKAACALGRMLRVELADVAAVKGISLCSPLSSSPSREREFCPHLQTWKYVQAFRILLDDFERMENALHRPGFHPIGHFPEEHRM